MTESADLVTPSTILRPRMPELDSVRGLAILGVFLYHTLYAQPDLSRWSTPYRLFLTATWPGHFGVSLFFVLSGFLITGILVDGRCKRQYFARFYKRRALRILPAYFAVAALLAVTKFAPPSFLLLSLVYLSNLTPIFGIPIAYPVLWSLAVEEHFYFVWPILCRKFTNTGLSVLCLGIVALSPLSRYVSLSFTAPGGTAFYCNEYTWNSLDGLACGALLSLALRQYDWARARFAQACGALLIFSTVSWFCLMPLGIQSRETGIGAAFQISIVNFAFTGLLGIFLHLGSGKHAPLVQIKPLRFLGYVSYGWYLIHDFFNHVYDRVMMAAGFAHGANHIGALLIRLFVVGGVSLGVAYLSRAFYEEYFLRFKEA